ncbi:MAG: hypothetical protein GYA48_05960 [Chloroflexi bacterium]|nr:hypothetical protein [Chloroflexota bacterium]
MILRYEKDGNLISKFVVKRGLAQFAAFVAALSGLAMFDAAEFFHFEFFIVILVLVIPVEALLAAPGEFIRACRAFHWVHFPTD